MNEKRFKRIETKEEVLILLGQGEHIFDNTMTEFYYDKDNEAVMRCDERHVPILALLPINTFLEGSLYIKKPFDVREAMRERPGEWVGKYEDGGTWWAVGFDERHFNVIAKPKDKFLPVDTSLTGITFPKPEDLDKCIPINELVKEES